MMVQECVYTALFKLHIHMYEYEYVYTCAGIFKFNSSSLLTEHCFQRSTFRIHWTEPLILLLLLNIYFLLLDSHFIQITCTPSYKYWHTSKRWWELLTLSLSLHCIQYIYFLFKSYNSLMSSLHTIHITYEPHNTYTFMYYLCAPLNAVYVYISGIVIEQANKRIKAVHTNQL